MNSRHDGQLLTEVASNGSEAAFAELVRRHSSMVLNQSRRLLFDTHEAEDATQAVFLVLWKKARSLRNSVTVAAWLHGVTRNVCSNAQRARNARKLKERKVMEMNRSLPEKHEQWDEIKDVLDDELYRLPEKYRLPLILFHLESRQLDEIAGLLDTNSSTVGTRLRRGREMLRSRIVGRGVKIGAAPLLAAIGAHVSAAEMPASFAATTAKSTSLFGAGHVVPTGALSTQSIALAKGTLQMLTAAKIKMVAVSVAAVVALGGGSAAVVNAVLLPAATQPAVLSAAEKKLDSEWKSLSELDRDQLAKRHLHAIAHAFHAYIEDHNGALPPAAVPNPDLAPGKRLSGLVLLLPYLGVRPSYIPEDSKAWNEWHADNEAARRVFKLIDLEKAWDDPANAEASRTIVPEFLAPSGAAFRDEQGSAVSHFAFVRGSRGRDNGMFPLKGETKLSIPDIGDGTINTLAMGQVHTELGPWIAEGPSTARFINHPSVKQKVPGFGSQHPGAAYFANGDAATYFWDIAASKPEALHNFAGRSDKRLVNRNDLSRFPSAMEWEKSRHEAGGK